MTAKQKAKSSKNVRQASSNAPPAAAVAVSRPGLAATTATTAASRSSVPVVAESAAVSTVAAAATGREASKREVSAPELPKAPTGEARRRLTAELAYLRAVELGFGHTDPLADWVWAEAEIERRYGSTAHAA